MVLSRLFAGLKKTRERLSSGLSRLFSRGRKLDEAFLDELEEVLYTSDLGPTGSAIVAELKEAYKLREVQDLEDVPGFLRDRLIARLAGCEGELAVASEGPTVVLVVGVNGSGKTTSIAKLAFALQRECN